MSTIHEYKEMGGFWGGCNELIYRELKDSSNKYYFSIQSIMNSQDNRAKTKEIQTAFEDENHPMHYLISRLYIDFLIASVTEEAKASSHSQLMEKYQNAFLVDIGITRAEIDYRREIDKKNGRLGGAKRVAIREQIKDEITRLYYSQSSLWDLPATHVATRIHKDLIAFLKADKFKKTDYSPRVIAALICEIRKKKSMPFRGDKGNS